MKETATETDAGELRRHLLESLSHDLRSPITSIYMWVEILERKRDETSLLRGLEVIARSARAQARMLDEALEVSSVLDADCHIENTLVDFASIVQQELSSLPETADGGPAPSLERHSDNFEVKGDAARLRQLVHSLIVNARRVAPQLQLRLLATAGEIKLQVIDAGAGEQESRLVQLFESSTTKTGDGKSLRFSALQLLAARRIAELHGGTIQSATPSPDEARASIVLRLPR